MVLRSGAGVVGERERPRDVEHPALERTAKKRAVRPGVDPFGHRQPDEQPAHRVGPGDRPVQRGEVLVQRRQHDVPLAAIDGDQARDVPLVDPVGEEPLEELLGEVRRAEVVVPLQAQDGAEQGFGQDAVARLEPRAEGLAEGPGQDHRLSLRSCRQTLGGSTSAKVRPR